MAGLIRFLFFLLLVLLARAVVGENAAAAANERPRHDGEFDVRARKWWPRFPPAEGLVRGSERRVPNSSDPLHNR